MTTEIYLDANATSPVLPAAILAAQAALLQCFGNPSSSHAAGLRARALLDDARGRARRVLGAATGRLMFTSGATEGIQTAVLSALCAVRERRAAGLPCGDLLLYGATEHKAVPESLAHWNALLGTGLTLQALPVDADGRHRLDALRTLAPRTAFLCTMAANNETGVVSDLDGIAAVLDDTGSAALWMVDCVQALGKLPLALDRTRIDYAPFSGHKLYAPKGIGMLWVRLDAPYTPLMCGGGQEAGQRSGTENMAGIAALGAVLRALEEGRTFRSHAQLAAMRERLAASLRSAFPGIEFNAPFEHALPTTLNFSVPGRSGKALLDLFDAAGVRVSAGSACSAAQAAPSYVLLAMELPEVRCANAVRMSFGPLADDAFIDEACARIARCGQALLAPPPAACPATGSGASTAAPAAPRTTTPGPVPCALDAQGLARFLGLHPDALLIDVREACEHALGAPRLHGRAAYSLPLSRLPEHAAWLCRETRPLVFFCRSGNRSAQAAHIAQELGHGTVRHLAGGLALLAS
jgi:cysteine desulfurase